MPLSLSITELVERFPQFRVALLLAADLELRTERSAALDALILEREAECRERWKDIELSAIPGVAAWRSAYKGFGVKKTSYRSSVERLIKRVKAGERMPVVNTLVDIYNVISLTHVFCCGADDLDKVAPPLAFRFARPHDSFVDMGAEPGEDPNDPPKLGEVVYADSGHVLCRRWNWRQDARTAISPTTREAVITIQANGWGDLDAAVADLSWLLAESCGAGVRTAIAEARQPTIEL